MIGRRLRETVLNTIGWRAGLLALSSGLLTIGVWLDQQFAVSRGPVRGASPELVVWVSLAAVGLVLVLWIAAERTAARKSNIHGSRGGRS